MNPAFYLTILFVHNCTSLGAEEARAKKFLDGLNKRAEDRTYRLKMAKWGYDSNITDSNLQQVITVTSKLSEEEKQDWQELMKFDWQSFQDYDLKRQFEKNSHLVLESLPKDKIKRYNTIVNKMTKIYSTSKICAFDDPTKCDLALEPDLVNILANSRNPDQLKHVWVEWRNAVGPHCKNLFSEYVELGNEAARLGNFTDTSDQWLHSYEDSKIMDKVEELWKQLRPLYLQIHAYVRTHLRKTYGDLVTEKGPIPAHLLGNMWSQSWRNLAKFILPFPDKRDEDFTEELKKQNYTYLKIFKTAEDFFKSINLTALPESFWKNSILKKPADREIVCHASAWDFGNRKDFRIKQCTETTIQNFVTAHHEMGHVEYYIQYKDQPITYRKGANNGFHEAVGDLISLSVQSRKHLRKIGLLTSQNDDPESTMNTLFSMGLEKIVMLPFTYLMDLWRRDVFKGKTTPDNYNCKWWELREQYQGVEPPVERSEEDFDPAAKFHTVASIPYLRYFVSIVIQFQFHQAVCEKAGQFVRNDPTKPLHECDIYRSTEAGNALKKMLQMGSSRPWPDAFEVLTGQRHMDGTALLEYFKPLQNWLEAENKKTGAFIGWEKSTKVCTKTKTKSK